MAVNAAVSINQVTEWIPKVIEYLEPFKPEIKKMSINYRSRDSEISMSLNIPDGFKRKIRKIEIPRYSNFEIQDLMAAQSLEFLDLDDLIEIDERKIKIKCSGLPASENYLLSLKGSVPQQALDKIVYIQPSVNKDRTEDTDKYWLNSMIKDVELLESVWDGLNIDEVTASVNIGVERYISAKLPENINRDLELLKKWASIWHRGDRNEVYTTMKMMKKTVDSKISVQKIFELFNTLTATEFFSGFIDVDSPYNLGKVENNDVLKTMPENIYAEALTKLTLKQPTAEGYMNFRKQKYIDCVEKKFNELE